MAAEAIEFSLKFRIFDNALLLCQEYFTRTPTPELLYLYAKAYLESGSPVQAAALCKQNENLIEKNDDMIIMYAQALFESGKYAEADQTLRQIQTDGLSDDSQAAAFYLKGIIKMRTHRHRQAHDDFAKAMKVQPLLVSVIRGTSGNSCDVEPAKPQKQQSLMTPKQLRAANAARMTPNRASNAPRPTQTPCITATLLKNAMNPQDTINSLTPDLQNSIQALKALGCYHFRGAKYHEAEHVFRRLYELHPHTMEGVDTFSTVLWQLKDEKGLNQIARRAVEIAPSRSESWIAMGNLMSLQHNTDSAIQMFQRAATVDKSCSYALALAGHELLLFDSLSEAAKLFRQSIDRNPSEWSAWYGIGSVHFRQDNFNAAEYYMKKALDLNPQSSVLLYVYAMVLRKCGRDDEALPMFDRALELDPLNLVAAFQKGILLDDIGDVAGAIECLKKAEALTPHEPAVAFMRGKIARGLGNYEEATTWFTDALIYGHPDKKEIHATVERMTDKILDAVLEQTETTEATEDTEETKDIFDDEEEATQHEW